MVFGGPNVHSHTKRRPLVHLLGHSTALLYMGFRGLYAKRAWARRGFVGWSVIILGIITLVRMVGAVWTSIH